MLRAKYGEDDAKENSIRVQKELENLKSSLDPETSLWWQKMIQEAQLTSNQSQILSASLGSMLMYGEKLTGVGDDERVESQSRSGTGTGDAAGVGGQQQQEGDKKNRVRMI